MLRTFSLDRREQYEAYFRRPVKKHTDRRESSTPPFILADLRLLTPFIILLQGGLLAAVFVLPEPETGKNRGLTTAATSDAELLWSSQTLPPKFTSFTFCSSRLTHRFGGVCTCAVTAASPRCTSCSRSHSMERLSPPSFPDSRQGVWSEPDRLHHVQDRREESTSFPIPFPHQRALSLRI